MRRSVDINFMYSFYKMVQLKSHCRIYKWYLNIDYSTLNNPQNRINFCEEVLNNIQDRTDLTYTNLAESITKAISSISVKHKQQAGWFQASEKELSPLIEASNEAM